MLYEKNCEELEKREIEKYTIYELDNPFPFYLLDFKKFNISLPSTPYFKYITIENWRPGYNIAFYDEKGEFATYRNIGFTKEENAIQYFYELLSYVSQKNEKGDCNG